MNIEHIGKYVLTEDYSVHRKIDIAHLAKGTTINITQVDLTYGNVFSPELEDWVSGDIPCVEVTDE